MPIYLLEEAENGGTNGWGKYTIPVKSNLKQYYVIQDDYQDEWGEGIVIAPIKGTTGNDRFYVMALNYISNDSYYWYYNAYGKLNNLVSTTSNDFGTGKDKTNDMIKKWNNEEYGAQNEDDLWGVIQQKDGDGKSKIEKGWFVPSKSELAAFADKYSLYGEYLWTSSQYDAYSAYYMDYYTGFFENGVLSIGRIRNVSVNYNGGTAYPQRIRLAITF